MTRADIAAAHRQLCAAVQDLARIARAESWDLEGQHEPWDCHPDYPDRIAAVLDRAATTVRESAAEFRRALTEDRS